MILLECGHTICHMCTSAMGKKEGKIICPDDKTNMALNRVAPNLTLLQMLKRICTVCERIFGEELKEEPTEKKYFCAKCLDLLNKRKDEVKRNIWAKIAVIQKKNSEAVEAIQTLVLMLENLKKEYLVHEKQRIEKCEFLRSMLENEKDLEEDEIKEFMEDVEKMNKEREKRKIDLKAIEHIKMLMDELFTKKDTQSFLNFIQLHSKSLENSAANDANMMNGGGGANMGANVNNGLQNYGANVNNGMCGMNQSGASYNPHNGGGHMTPHPMTQPPSSQQVPPTLTAAQLQQQHEAQVRKILRSGCPSNKTRPGANKTTLCSCNGAHH